MRERKGIEDSRSGDGCSGVRDGEGMTAHSTPITAPLGMEVYRSPIMDRLGIGIRDGCKGVLRE